jgi:hypothetical protein
LLNKAIGLENKTRELSDHNRKFQGQSSRNTRQNNSQGSQFRSRDQGGNNYQMQRSDNKVREAIKLRTSKGIALRPTKGLVVIRRLVKEALLTHMPKATTTHQSNPMAVSSAANLAIMLTTAQGTTNRHPRRTAVRELTRTHPLVDLCKTKRRRTRIEEGLIT